jgi:Fe-S cluster assembly protein SufD
MTTDTREKKRVLHLSRIKLEPDWMRELRLAALASFESLPEVRWESSDLTRRKTGLFQAKKTAAPCPDMFELGTFFLKNGRNRLAYANACIVAHHLEASLAQKGVLLVDLSLAIRVYPKLVRPFLGQLIPHTENKWVALQTALWNAGVFLYVPKGVRVEVPLQAWWHRTQAGGKLHPRVLVVAEENSDVTLLTGEVSSLEEEAFSIKVTEVFAKQGARVRIASIGEQDEQMTRLTFNRAHVERDAQVEWLFAEGGAGFEIAEVTSVLTGDAARSKTDVAALGRGGQHLDLTLVAHHIGRHTESAIRGRVIAAGSSRSYNQVLSRIEKGAIGTNSIQEVRMILLDDTAQVQAIPMLLIDEEDVKCDHALSAGKLSAEHLFYLMSRGLSEGEAKRLLLLCFLSPLQDGMKIPGMQEALNQWIERAIPR